MHVSLQQRRRVGRRLNPGRVRALTRDRETVRSGRLGRIRLLRVSHSRFFWGLCLHLVCTLSGLPVTFALTGAKADERELLLGCSTPTRTCSSHPSRSKVDGRQELLRHAIRSRARRRRIELLRPARKGEKPRPDQQYFKPLRQVIESINDTLKSQLDLERHGGRTIAGVASRVLQRILALTAAIWHNDQQGQPTLRSLTAYDH